MKIQRLFLYTFEESFISFEVRQQENDFLEGEKIFLSPFFKSVKKVEMSITKNLEFGF